MDYQQLSSWTEVKYEKVKRDDHSYEMTESFFSNELSKLINSYQETTDPQAMRLTRDLVDFCLRRHHGYAIKERIGGHYKQIGIGEKTIFEHLIPASTIRDLLLSGNMSIRHAMNAPTVILSQENDLKLRASGQTSRTDSLIFPFKRYLQAGITDSFMTFKGMTLQNLETWTLEDHYNMIFG